MENQINLEEIEKEIRDYAKLKGIQIFEGSLEGSEENWIMSISEDYKKLLDCVANSGNKLIILDKEEISEDFFEIEDFELFGHRASGFG